MKLDARQLPNLLRNPAQYRMVLLHGSDEGLIREHAQALTKSVAGTLNDPFLVAELNREDWPRIQAEMTALSMIGGRRVVRVRDAADAVFPQIQTALKSPGEALLILEAPGLGKGKLRNFAEADPACASIACYPEEGQALLTLIKSAFTAAQVTIEPDALAWLSDKAGGDRAVVRGEIEKLVLLAGQGGHVTLEMARICTGETAGAAGDEAVTAACAGDIIATDQAVETAIADGLNGVAILRIALGHLQKLHQARLRMDAGLSPPDAIRTLRPPVFFKSIPAMSTSLTIWPADALLRAIEEARLAELACKQTGSRQELIARRFLASLARQGAARRRK